jgi:DNA-binding HxlR family transcriptional regulator
MTTENQIPSEECPAQGLLKILSGKWKARIMRLAVEGPLRFNRLLRQLPDANKQSLATALKELEEAGILHKTTLRLKPLHIEYALSDKGQEAIQLLRQLENW